LIKNGANVNAINDLNHTPLHLTVKANNQEIVALLISKGANINAEDCTGTTPSLAAALKGHEDILNFLLEQGAIIDPTHKTIRYQFNLAISFLDEKTALRLIKYSQNQSLVDEFKLSVERGLPNVALAIVEAGLTYEQLINQDNANSIIMNTLFAIIAKSYMELFKKILTLIDINFIANTREDLYVEEKYLTMDIMNGPPMIGNFNLLEYAAFSGQIEFVKILADMLANIDLYQLIEIAHHHRNPNVALYLMSEKAPAGEIYHEKLKDYLEIKKEYIKFLQSILSEKVKDEYLPLEIISYLDVYSENKDIEAQFTERQTTLKDKVAFNIRAIKENLEKKGYEVVNVPSDGDCFFHAITRTLSTEEINSSTLSAIDYIENHRDDYAEFLPENDVGNFININRNSGEWADHPIMQAVADSNNIVIEILDYRERTEIITPRNQQEPPLQTVRILYTGNHYLAILAHDHSDTPSSTSLEPSAIGISDDHTSQTAEENSQAPSSAPTGDGDYNFLGESTYYYSHEYDS
jgi:hypothetical protein